MSKKRGGHGAPTRRDYLKYGGVTIGGGLLAGCAGLTGSDTTSTETGTSSTNTAETSYSVTMSPVGEVTFEETPSNVMAYSPQYVDMLVAFGHADSLNSVGFPGDTVTGLQYFYDTLDGVSLSTDGLTQLFNDGMDKELFYELDSDVHLMDPAWATTFKGWSRDDVEEIAENVGPWFANRYSRQHAQPPEAYRDDYQYYTLWELSEKVAAVFGEQERFEALKSEYEALYGTIRANLPPKSERPTVGLLSYWDGEFYPYKISGPGFGKAHVRPMGARDAFADSDKTYAENYDATYNMEGVLDIDPDVILHIFGVGPWYDWDEISETVSSDPVGKELTAVQNDRFYASGGSFQGPLKNLLQLEMTAKQLYPDAFGEWPRFEEGQSYPEFSKEEQLFDHQRVADIVTGDF
ncbi:ABC-type Fe3+-hydroxamate transport system, substrate-binding protein [Haladaptatus litoreus]|uniref:ABC-type Fe3+-hydroxamate transport system, substrate-binding protein n=1 Tax=Haladaptatus litoreus TaxID=553468 RepID=A0A1N6XEE6_9EURY|nr:ABC transporter substrate-binding protein [Haladaptatus litoreus]SIR00640.1 ABC-type Fe3+-hydroxamate transport system, substrate-binding protein [Haladaptatus litoreus]